jgi:hypothetical protein
MTVAAFWRTSWEGCCSLPDGTPWGIHFPTKTVQWIRFRIDSAQGKNEGLAEIMIYGELYAGGNSAG